MTVKLKTKKPARKASKTAAPPKKRLTKAEQLKREVARRNRVFKAASPAKKRMLIAQDVINQIKAKRYQAQTGRWVELVSTDRYWCDPVLEYGPDASIRELFLGKKIESCECCALGAMFMSCTLYNNQTTAEQFEEEMTWGCFEDLVEEPGKLSNGLNKFFSPEQLRLIESAFEGNCGAFRAPKAVTDKTESWYNRYEHDAKRMIAIMENIIKNKGTFKP